MKRTWRASISAVVVLSMVLSMLLVSGLTFTASALAGLHGGVFGTDYDEVIVTEVAYGTAANLSDCYISGGTATAAYPNPWMLQLNTKTAGAGYARVTFGNIQAYPYVMIAVDPDKTTVNAYTFMGQSNTMGEGQYNYITKPTAAVGSEIYSTYVANPQTHIVDLRTIPGNENATTYTIYIMLDGDVGDVFYVNSMVQYTGTVATTTNLPLVNFGAENISYDVQYGAANAGNGFATVAGTYVEDGKFSVPQTSFWVSAAEVAARPYLVLELKPDTAAQFSNVVIYDAGGGNRIDLVPSDLQSLKTIDLTRYLSSGCWIHLFYNKTTINTASCEFTQAYLTAFNGNAVPTYYESDKPIFSIAATTNTNIAYFSMYGADATHYGFSTVAVAGQVGLAAVPITAEQIAKTPYLVLQKASDSSGANVSVVTTDPGLGVAAVSDYAFDPHAGVQVVNLPKINNGNTVWLQISTAGTEKGIVNLTQAYLTALPGFAENKSHGTADALLSNQAASHNGIVGNYGSSGKGLSITPPTTVAEKDALSYEYDIPAASVINTPFLVMQADTRFTSGLTAQLYLVEGQTEKVLRNINLDGSVHIISLRLYNAFGTQTLRLRLLADGAKEIKFTLAYLTASPNTAKAADGIASSYSIVADAHMPDFPTADAIPSNIAIHKLGNAGYALVDNGGSGDHLAYYVFRKAQVDENPYLIYKSRQNGARFSIYGVYGPTWWDNAEDPNSSLILDGQLHVLDLRTMPGYSDGGTVLLQLGWLANEQGPMLFDCLILANTPDFDYTTIAADANSTYIVHYEERGGAAVADEYIKKDQPITSVTEKEGYNFGGWYIISGGQKLDAPAVTADMTVYAKYAIAGEFGGKTSPVYAQLQNGVTGASESAKIRFVMAIKQQQLYEFDEVGFVISTKNANPTVGGSSCVVTGTDTVYTSIVADGAVVTARQLGGDYICALTLANIKNKNFDSNIYVCAFARASDGTLYYSSVRTYTVNGMLIGQV